MDIECNTAGALAQALSAIFGEDYERGPVIVASDRTRKVINQLIAMRIPPGERRQIALRPPLRTTDLDLNAPIAKTEKFYGVTLHLVVLTLDGKQCGHALRMSNADLNAWREWEAEIRKASHDRS